MEDSVISVSRSCDLSLGEAQWLNSYQIILLIEQQLAKPWPMNDTEWQKRFIIPNLASVDKQDSEITYLVPWCKIGTPPEEGASVLASAFPWLQWYRWSILMYFESRETPFYIGHK